MGAVVTVIIPAVESVLRQSEKRFELWIVDDNSIDNTVEIAEQYTYDGRVRVYKNNRNMGLAKLLNHYHAMVETPFTARMDSDDVMFENRLEMQLKVFDLFPFIDVLGSKVVPFAISYSCPKNLLVREPLARVKTIAHPTLLARSIWLKSNLYSESLRRNEDAELWIRCSTQYNIYQLNQPLLYYREIPSEYARKYKSGLLDAVAIWKRHKNARATFFLVKYILATFIYQIFDEFNSVNVLLNLRQRR
jgi:glycosyltransferase involved in cell wall biosynthesis